LAEKPPSKTKTTAGRRPQINGLAPVREEVQQKPYFNPLPTAPVHYRPAPQLFVWGAGNFGQFGMGPNFLGEFSKPKRSLWIEEQMKEGTFGSEGAGLEAAAAGGLHTLLIDEKGTVSMLSNSFGPLN
jgi:regulator of chromosome condensation